MCDFSGSFAYAIVRYRLHYQHCLPDEFGNAEMLFSGQEERVLVAGPEDRMPAVQQVSSAAASRVALNVDRHAARRAAVRQ